MTSPTSPQSPAARPRIVDIAFWLLAVGAVVLIMGGLQAVTMSFDTARSVAPSEATDDMVRSWLTLCRATGVFYIVVGVVLAFVAGKTRGGDPRFRRATIGLTLSAVVLAVLFTVVVGISLPVLVALAPLLIGAVLLTRPAAAQWFSAERERSDG